jgi:hypothetical protein
MTEHQGLPVSGYRPQSTEAVELVNANKKAEEGILRALDELKKIEEVDQRWLAIGRTHIEEGFMAINRSIFKPTRINL